MPRMKLVFVALPFILMFVAVAAAHGQLSRCDNEPIMCGIMGGSKTCSAVWTYGGYYSADPTVVTGAAMCSISRPNPSINFIIAFVAMRPITAAPTAGCHFAGDFGLNNPPGTPFTCVINLDDGLPVELLDFEIDSMDSPADETAPDAQ